MAKSGMVDTSRAPTGGPTFGEWLKHWRGVRGLSQLSLAGEADISARHLSFLETGRSLPSRDMVQRLTETLDVPHGDRNIFLLAAGYAPSYPADDFAAEEFDALERILAFIISQQTSFPALVIDECWNIRMRNTIATQVFAEFRPFYRLPEELADNALHILCHPEGLRQFMVNWTEYVEPFAREINREASINASSAAKRLRDELLAYPGMPDVTEASGKFTGMAQPVLTMRLRRENTSLAFYTAFTTFVLPFARGSQTVKIECFYPADPVTARTVDKLTKSIS